jgi:2-polyprenyl-6-methoxyphenol hydroxylase-like FAD-dependent oxidoreductase
MSALAHIDALNCVMDKGFAFSTLSYTNEHDDVVAMTELNRPEYEYGATRILRKVCIQEWTKLLEDQGIPIHHFCRFGGIKSDDHDNGVSFRINDGIKVAGLLIAADGIHSTVRKHVSPNTSLDYLGLMGIMCHVPFVKIKWPREDYPIISTVMAPTGGFMAIHEVPDKRIALVARQVSYP